jgi:RecB family exonuclease
VVRHREIVSAGALETYGDCPVKWLVEGELQPSPLDPDPEPLVRGSYIHDLLERVIRELGDAVTPESLPRALSALSQEMRDPPAGLAAGQPAALRAAALRAIEADLRRYLAHEATAGSRWRPRQLERRFGFDRGASTSGVVDDEPSLPALTLEGDGVRVRVRGVIDRIDVDPVGRQAIVRDYKSGSVRPQHPSARWEEDRRLQVALYMLVARDLLGLDPVAGVYQPLSGEDMRPRGIALEGSPVQDLFSPRDVRSREALDAELSGAGARAVALAGRLARGDLTPCPKTCSRDGCSYPGICRSQ